LCERAFLGALLISSQFIVIVKPVRQVELTAVKCSVATIPKEKRFLPIANVLSFSSFEKGNRVTAKTFHRCHSEEQHLLSY
jgi:hypothetical protein